MLIATSSTISTKETLQPKSTLAMDELVGLWQVEAQNYPQEKCGEISWLKEGDVLTEEYITKFDEEKQEICNQQNRRTEFIVLRTSYGIFDKKSNLKKRT